LFGRVHFFISFLFFLYFFFSFFTFVGGGGGGGWMDGGFFWSVALYVGNLILCL